MKNFNSLLFFAVGIIIYSCSSPEKDGNKVGITFCDCMNGKINSDNSPSSLFSLSDSCKSITDMAIRKVEDKYKTDALKLLEVKTAYLNTTQKTYSDHQEALSKSIGNALAKQIWVKDDETTTENYLFSFASNKITPLNGDSAQVDPPIPRQTDPLKLSL